MDIVPLYYNMRKAAPQILSSEILYKGMVAAYTGGNIGEISNKITKIWNSDDPDIDAIKILCLKNNETIDYAKTLYKSKTPKEWEERIRNITNVKVPAFFEYAKGKAQNQIAPRNNSCVNRLYYMIHKYKFRFSAKELGTFNYKALMHNPDIEWNEYCESVIQKWKDITHYVSYRIVMGTDVETSNVNYIMRDIMNQMSEMCSDKVYLVDILVKYLFGLHSTKRKNVFWNCYADVVLDNLKANVEPETILCERCGKRISPENGRQKFCPECAELIRKSNVVEYVHSYRERINM